MDPQPPAAAAAADDPLALRLPGGRIVGSDQLVFRATTSGGPGGQHANKTASRIEVVVRIADLPLEPREVALVYERLATRVTGAGELAASCAEHREQHRNRKVAVRRLERLICDALVVQRRRIPTRMSMGARMRRRDDKQQASRRKRSRGTDWSEDD